MIEDHFSQSVRSVDHLMAFGERFKQDQIELYAIIDCFSDYLIFCNLKVIKTQFSINFAVMHCAKKKTDEFHWLMNVCRIFQKEWLKNFLIELVYSI